MLFKTNLTSASACWAFLFSPPDAPRKLLQLCCGPPGARSSVCQLGWPMEIRVGKSWRYLLPWTPSLPGHWQAVATLIQVTFPSSYTLQIPETTLSFVPSGLRVMVSPAAALGCFTRPCWFSLTCPAFVNIPDLLGHTARGRQMTDTVHQLPSAFTVPCPQMAPTSPHPTA